MLAFAPTAPRLMRVRRHDGSQAIYDVDGLHAEELTPDQARARGRLVAYRLMDTWFHPSNLEVGANLARVYESTRLTR